MQVRVYLFVLSLSPSLSCLFSFEDNEFLMIDKIPLFYRKTWQDWMGLRIGSGEVGIGSFRDPRYSTFLVCGRSILEAV